MPIGSIGHTSSTSISSTLRRRPYAVSWALIAVIALTLSACDTGNSDPATIEREPSPTDATGSSEPDADGGHDGEPDDSGTSDDSSTATTTDPGDGPDDPDEGRLLWGRCDDDVPGDHLDCASLPVPLDHDDPEGPTIDIALVRLAAAGSREGAVLMNPGGPGGSGVDLVAAIATFATTEMGLADFDIVGFDPRGVDRSNGLRCLDDDEVDELVFDRYDDLVGDGTPDADAPDADTPDADTPDAGTPDAGTDTTAHLGGDDLGGELDDDRLFEACVAEFGDTLQHYSTEATARDMDLIREAMGDDTLSYIGISYGTYLGAVYATLFPERVRALVLDSAIEPTGDTIEQQYLTQLVGFEEAFEAWAADCQADPACTFGGDDVAGSWDALSARLGTEPLENADGRAGTPDVLETATVSALYDRLTWPQLASALTEAEAGDPSGLFVLADAYMRRAPDGSYATLHQSNPVIRCASGFTNDQPDDPEAFAQLIRESAPRFGANFDADSFGDPCDQLAPDAQLLDLAYDGDAPIVVIGGVNDPATPFRWSEEMTEKLGPSATLVTWNGEGHGQLFGSSCLLDVAGRVVADLEPPEPGAVCDPDPDVERPAFWDDIPVPDGISAEPLPPDAMLVLGLPPRMVYGEARTSTLTPDEVLAAYDTALAGIGFEAFGVEEPLPGLQLATYLSPTFEIISVLVLDESAYDEPDLAPAERLIDDGEVLLAVISFPM